MTQQYIIVYVSGHVKQQELQHLLKEIIDFSKIREAGCGLTRTLSQVAITSQWKLPDFIAEMLFHIQGYIKPVRLPKSKMQMKSWFHLGCLKIMPTLRRQRSNKATYCDTKHSCIWPKMGSKISFIPNVKKLRF